MQVPNGVWTFSVVPAAGWGDAERARQVWFLALLASLALTAGFALARSTPLRLKARVERQARLLAQRQALFGSLFEQSGVLAVILAGDGRVLEVNQTALTLMNLDRDAVVGRPFPDTPWWRGADRLRLDEALAAARGGLPDSFEVVRPGARGGEIQVLLTVRPVTSGAETYLAVTGVDVSARKAAETALRESQTLRSLLFENAAVGLAQVSTEGRFIQINQTYCQLIGYAVEEVLSEVFTFQQITDPEDLAEDLRQVGRLLDGEADTYSMEKRYRHKDGHVVWVDLWVRLQRDEHGRPAYFISAVSDISQRKAVESALLEQSRALAVARDQAEAASRAKSAFLANMSHELRTPLNGILGFAHLLQHADLPSKARDHARHIAEQGGQLLGLIDEVMEFTRLETLERPRHRGRLDPGLVLSELAQVLRRAAADMGLAVRIDLPADLPPRLAGEADWLAGCLRPLIHNAVKFTETGEVGLSVRGERSETGDGELYRLRVTVHDSGVGIAEQDHGKLFQPFRQTDDSTARRFHGLGLGLAVSARYAALLGGRLDFDSAPGRGSRFCLDWTTRCLPPAGSETGKVVTGDAGEALAQLRRLLSQDDLEAHRALREALPLLAPLFDAEDLARLGAQVEKFDYGAALETLAEMRELSPGRP